MQINIMKSAKKFIIKIKNNLIFYKKLTADDQTPKISKMLLSTAIAYALSPIDLIPDFIPIIGNLDDIIIIPGLISLAIWLIPRKQIEKIKREMSA